MRLLNAQTLKFEEYSDTKAPPYAILSHTWQAEEVSLQDFYRPDAATTAGYQKIKRFCQLAITSGLTYVWVDTCCIDKTSSAELSEAINSMFRWYEKSAICFAYLADVSAETESLSPLLTNSCWFTRGWTLQELLAPRVVLFIGSNWKVFGNRDSLAYQISAITGIGNRYLTTRAAEAHYRTSDEPYYDDYGGHLERLSHIREATVAEKLSWAATRQTTREEDVAYCLLGLCAVNMPLLYGEGPAAFLRLQEAIIRQKFDPTLLAWNVVINDSRGRRVLRPENPVASSKWRSVGKALFGLESPWSHRNGDEFRSLNFLCPGILAPSPICFSGCDQYVNLQATLDWDLTSRGLSISLPTSKNTNPCMLLPCHKRDDPWSLVAIPLIGFNDEFFDRAAAPVEFIDRQKWQIWLPRRLLLSTYAPMWNRIRQSNLETIRIYVDAKLQCLDLVASREVYRLSDGMGSQETDKTYTVDVEATVIPSSQLRVLLPESMHVRFNHSVRSAGQATGLAPVDWDNWERVEMPKNINEPEPLLVTIRQVTSTQAPEYLLRIIPGEYVEFAQGERGVFREDFLAL
ncbi:hypothetical protein NUW58_g6747 [Xylaria curta]|uniref:Uncharacterized protein n=1 Tax=Xylaria curta TaxID=42375 RepID=A0ACC1NQW2_9PEZI|nr:hypothetical protein NUW58_g6747 [Xylaria curta]